MERMNTIFTCGLLLVLFNLVQSQWANIQNNNPTNDRATYYMDNNADCSKKYELGQSSATLYGTGAVNQNNPPTTCIITFSSDNVRDKRKFRIEVAAATFGKTGVDFYIFDGSSTASNRLAAFGFQKDKPPNYQPLFTSGGFVTFQLQKTHTSVLDFNVKILITPIAADVNIIDECPTGEGPGCYNYNTRLVITKEIVIGIVGGVFGLVIIIIIIVVVCYYYRKTGVIKRWNEFSLGQANTAATIASSSGKVAKSSAWASQSSKYPLSAASVRTSPSKCNDSEVESVFDAPPPYEKYDNERSRNYDSRDRGSNRRGRYDSRDRDRDQHYRRDKYDDRERDIEMNKRSRRDREERRNGGYRRRSRSQDRSFSQSDYSDNSSFVQADDDHPQEQFVERIIEPRVRPKPAGRVKKAKQEEDSVYDELDEREKDQGVQCQAPSDVEDNESNTETTDGENTSSESDSEPEKDTKAKLYAKPNKKKKKKSQPDSATPPTTQAPPPPPPQQPMVNAMPHVAMGGFQQMQPGVMYRPGMPPPGVVVRPAIPNAQPAVNGTFFIPTMNQGNPIIRPQVQPMAKPMGSNYPIMYSNQPKVPQSLGQQPASIPQGPPLYSHRVQRGYAQSQSMGSSTPDTSSQSGVLNLTDGSDGHNLGSGVDLLKRTTDV